MEKFGLQPFLNQWFRWDRINTCFWPGAGSRSEKIDPGLSPIRRMSGIYVIAWGDLSGSPSPECSEVQYVGMTDNFKNRMGQFATSSGIHYEERYSGHSAAWRWPQGKSELMHIAFFPLLLELMPHLKVGLLHWQEALAIDMYYKKHGVVPPLNAGIGLIDID